jgi:hypothetical protein
MGTSIEHAEGVGGTRLSIGNLSEFAHLLGLGLFLGSIATFAAASGVPAAGDVESLSVARRVIGAGTSFVTLPALGVLVLSGLGLLWSRGRARWQAWLGVMVAAGVLVVANTVFVVTPAVRSATALAQEATAGGQLPDGYSRANAVESAAGGVNIALTLVAMVCGVWRFGSRPEGAGARGLGGGRS